MIVPTPALAAAGGPMTQCGFAAQREHESFSIELDQNSKAANLMGADRELRRRARAEQHTRGLAALATPEFNVVTFTRGLRLKAQDMDMINAREHRKLSPRAPYTGER